MTWLVQIVIHEKSDHLLLTDLHSCFMWGNCQFHAKNVKQIEVIQECPRNRCDTCWSRLPQEVWQGEGQTDGQTDDREVIHTLTTDSLLQQFSNRTKQIKKGFLSINARNLGRIDWGLFNFLCFRDFQWKTHSELFTLLLSQWRNWDECWFSAAWNLGLGYVCGNLIYLHIYMYVQLLLS